MPNVLKNKPRHKIDEQEITRFNWKRENCAGRQFNASEFKELLKSMGYATSGNWIKCICDGENPPFIRVSRGQYVFNPKPVYIERLQTVWDAYANYGKRSSSHLDEKQLKLDVNNAVKLLKNLGYKILKPITQYEEV